MWMDIELRKNIFKILCLINTQTLRIVTIQKWIRAKTKDIKRYPENRIYADTRAPKYIEDTGQITFTEENEIIKNILR